MELTAEENKQYRIVDSYVRQYAKVWYFKPKECWNAAVTVLMDFQEFGTSHENAVRKLVNRIWSYKEARGNILAKYSEPLALYCLDDNVCPTTGKNCDDECCPPGAVCNLSGETISGEQVTA